MATTTDFKLWTDFVDLENYEEIYCIYKSISEVDEWGAFKCTMKKNSTGNMYFLKCDYCDDTLALVSEKAKDSYLKFIEDNYIKSDMDIESWYGYQHAMAKND